MKQILTILAMLLLMTAGTAAAGELVAPSPGSAQRVDLALVAAPAVEADRTADPDNDLPPELEPALLRERAFTESSAFAGVQVDLPTSPLSIVLAADEMLNPTYGVKLHLVW